MYIVACFFHLLVLTYIRSTAGEASQVDTASPRLCSPFLLLKPIFKGYQDTRNHFRISSTQTLWIIQHSKDFIFPRQTQGTLTTQWKQKTLNTVQLKKKDDALHSSTHNPFMCSNTGYSLISYSMIVYSPLLCYCVSSATLISDFGINDKR